MTDRTVWVVDVETTGLDVTKHVPIEVAAVNLDTGDEIYFVPYLSDQHLVDADKDALRINRYFERGVYRNMKDPVSTKLAWIDLFCSLRGNTLAGANPRFDAAMLLRGYAIGQDWPAGSIPTEPWHHRLADVAAYAAGACNRSPNLLPGLAECCTLFGVVNTNPHGAMDDARATAEVFRRAMNQEPAA